MNLHRRHTWMAYLICGYRQPRNVQVPRQKTPLLRLRGHGRCHRNAGRSDPNLLRTWCSLTNVKFNDGLYFVTLTIRNALIAQPFHTEKCNIYDKTEPTTSAFVTGYGNSVLDSPTPPPSVCVGRTPCVGWLQIHHMAPLLWQCPDACQHRRDVNKMQRETIATFHAKSILHLKPTLKMLNRTATKDWSSLCWNKPHAIQHLKSMVNHGRSTTSIYE